MVSYGITEQSNVKNTWINRKEDNSHVKIHSRHDILTNINQIMID